MGKSKKIIVKEVGPRDGLQNEKAMIETEDKISWIDSLSKTGLSYIEVTSFVHPKWIPQLADALQVAKGIQKEEQITYAALVPNMKGLESALTTNLDELSVFMSASETHNLKNINKSINDTFPVLNEVVKEILQNGKTARGYVSTVFGCPYEGKVSIDSVISVCDTLFEQGIQEISLGDTIGVANPRQVEEVLSILLKRYDASRLALHFHDTRGMALANIVKSIDMGITIFDASLGGLGGCPYAPGASGNVATDDLVHMLHEMGYETGIQEPKLLESGMLIQSKLPSPLSSHTMHVHSSNCN
ncbi:hydroxymethylglutaryl-CoA lyase [Peribacillus alkalitolerans]|uniref:hydroxymethylglutaryl-CoA lyase n=1 Tax=Peribacillus alkalitolerans TaxID=1550385 RepID=UPI0013D215B8|nr:hydroxymethylglutaryl-CoA lyase [Peribacillus alkalitolerans]